MNHTKRKNITIDHIYHGLSAYQEPESVLWVTKGLQKIDMSQYIRQPKASLQPLRSMLKVFLQSPAKASNESQATSRRSAALFAP